MNGAGKTSTFKMLTGEELVSGGQAFVKGFNVAENIKQVNLRHFPVPILNLSFKIHMLNLV